MAWIGLLVSALLNPICLAPVAQAQSPDLLAQTQPEQTLVLGVVRTSQNSAQWQAIESRLAGISYRIIDWQQVQQVADFGDVTVLLLPTVETIAPDQLLALQAWLNQGGRLIVSGPTGNQSSPGVRWALRSLLGGYWASSLSQPATLQITNSARQPWLQQGDTQGQVLGGVVVPTGLSSQPVAVWQAAGAANNAAVPEELAAKIGMAAVVITNQVTFLGWRWGADAALQSFDQRWLRAAIDRYQTDRLVRATPTPPSSETTPAMTPAAGADSASAVSSPVPQAAARRSAAPPRSASPAVAPSQDPAEQVAPPGLEVRQSTLPIGIVEAIAMRQELQNLIGRFESAVIAINSAASRSTAANSVPSSEAKQTEATPEATVTASATDSSLLAPASPSQADKVLQQAQQNLLAFSELVAQQDYNGARQQWLATRQLLWENFPTEPLPVQSEIRAMWLDRGTIVAAGSRRELEQIFDRLAAAGINTIFFETVNAGYPIYPSQVAPRQNPLIRAWDPLEAAVDLAHERGMELHAWVWTFAAGNRAHNAILNFPADDPGPVLAAHPDWANYDNRGNLIPPGQGKPFLDPANPEVRQYLLSLFEEIVTGYDVDGLQLDYIRYPFQDPGANRTYGYGRAARQQFQQRTGIDPVTLSPDSPQWQQWTEFRTQQVSSFVADTSELVHRLKPGIVLSTAVFALPEHQRLQEIQQHWEAWARQGDVDLVVLMSYARDTNRLQQLTLPWLTGAADLGAALILPGIRLLSLSETAIVDQIQALRDSPAGGYALFAMENLNPTLQQMFSRTQGGAEAAPIPYRQPLAAVASRYRALQQEWSYLQSQDQLWIRQRDREAWQTQVRELGETFERLAEEPSERSLHQARTQLQAFREQFEAWMYLQALKEGYRVRTWEYRLAALENLLNYGENYGEPIGLQP